MDTHLLDREGQVLVLTASDATIPLQHSVTKVVVVGSAYGPEQVEKAVRTFWLLSAVEVLLQEPITCADTVPFHRRRHRIRTDGVMVTGCPRVWSIFDGHKVSVASCACESLARKL